MCAPVLERDPLEPGGRVHERILRGQAASFDEETPRRQIAPEVGIGPAHRIEANHGGEKGKRLECRGQPSRRRERPHSRDAGGHCLARHCARTTQAESRYSADHPDDDSRAATGEVTGRYAQRILCAEKVDE